MARTIRTAKKSANSPGASKRQKVEPLNPGDEVVFHGLTTNVDLNGKSGELVEYDSDIDAWEVKTKFDVCISGDTDKMVFIKTENLKRKDHTIAAPDRERKSVYVLILEEWNHRWGAKTKVIGVYISKEAAVLASRDIKRSYGGTFNEEIEPGRGIYSDKFDHKDNRNNPPDDGILIQLGGRGIGEGDYHSLKIQKMPLL